MLTCCTCVPTAIISCPASHVESCCLVGAGQLPSVTGLPPCPSAKYPTQWSADSADRADRAANDTPHPPKGVFLRVCACVDGCLPTALCHPHQLRPLPGLSSPPTCTDINLGGNGCMQDHCGRLRGNMVTPPCRRPHPPPPHQVPSPRPGAPPAATHTSSSQATQQP